jgi:hypothetical protein
MSEEVAEVVAEVIPAPAQVETVTPAAEVEAPEVVEEAPAKSFTQEELDAAIGKRLAREQRKWEREQQQRVAEAVAAATPRREEELRPEQFATPEEYTDALVEKKAEQLIAKREEARLRQTTVTAYHEREEEARTKYDDFAQVAYNPALKISNVMAETIQSSDIGPDVAYFLGTNPKEADRIYRLPPILQAKEIGRIEAKLAAEPPKPTKVSSAPAPLSHVTPRSSGGKTYDTTDPRSIQSMTTSEWIEADRQRQIKKAQARKIS